MSRNSIVGNGIAIGMLALSLFVLLYTTLFAKPQQSITTEAVVVNVYDGDTVTLSITKEVKVRLQDCWAAELKQEGGKEAKEELEKLIPVGEKVLLEIPMESSLSKSITFGRFIGRVSRDLNGDGVFDDVSEEMVRKGFATKEKGKVIK